MPPGDRETRGRAPRGASRDAASDYRAKTAHEAARIARRLKGSVHPAPFGDPASGVVLVVEQPAGPRAVEALKRSLDFVGLPEAYVTWTYTGLLMQELLSTEPHALVAVGPGAVREIDALRHPLARASFAEAPEGTWFSWTRGTAGLRLPALAPALEDDAAKRRFWRAFVVLRDLAPAPRP